MLTLQSKGLETALDMHLQAVAAMDFLFTMAGPLTNALIYFQQYKWNFGLEHTIFCKIKTFVINASPGKLQGYFLR